MEARWAGWPRVAVCIRQYLLHEERKDYKGQADVCAFRGLLCGTLCAKCCRVIDFSAQQLQGERWSWFSADGQCPLSPKALDSAWQSLTFTPGIHHGCLNPLGKIAPGKTKRAWGGLVQILRISRLRQPIIKSSGAFQVGSPQ